MKSYLEILGYEVKDTVTGFAGVATCVSFDLYGCVQVVVLPKAERRQKIVEGARFDYKRLVKTGAKPVMQVPSFEFAAPQAKEPGAAEKPSFAALPPR